MGEATRTILISFATAFITAAATLFGSTLDYFNKDRELDLKMVDVSLAILRGEKGEKINDQSVHARRFALRALRSASGVDLSDSELETWATEGGNLQLSPIVGTALDWGLLGKLERELAQSEKGKELLEQALAEKERKWREATKSTGSESATEQ